MLNMRDAIHMKRIQKHSPTGHRRPAIAALLLPQFDIAQITYRVSHLLE